MDFALNSIFRRIEKPIANDEQNLNSDTNILCEISKYVDTRSVSKVTGCTTPLDKPLRWDRKRPSEGERERRKPAGGC